MARDHILAEKANMGRGATIEPSDVSLFKPTAKGFALGILLTFLLSLTEPYVKLILHTNGFCTDYDTAGALVFLFLLLMIVGGLRKVNRIFNISKPDLITIYTMLIVASAIPSHGLLAPLYPVISGVVYYATPENKWAEMIHPYIKDWVVLTDPEAARNFFEGTSDGRVPWGIWAKPLISWGMLISAVFAVMMFMMVILRKQWIERERLLFPLARLPLEMIKTDDQDRRTFLRSWLMWAGFAVAFIFIGLKGLHFYYNFIPSPNLGHDFYLLRNTTRIEVTLNFAVLGFAYLLALDVGMSIWFFHLLLKIESGMFNILGFDLKGHSELWGGSSLATTHQNGGAMIALVLFGLWMARGHLKGVFKKAFTGSSEIDDSDELVSYRTAVFGMIFCLAFIALWFGMAGVPWDLVPLVITACFLVFLALTKIVAQAGVGFMCTGISPPVLATSSIGTGPFGTQGIVTLGALYTWAFEGRTSVMASTANALKLSDEGKLSKKSLFIPIMLAIAITLIGSSWMILRSAYTYGGINLRSNWFVSMPGNAWQGFVSNKLMNPITPDMVLQRWIFMGVGGGIMLFLMLVGGHFPRWPLHYIGFPIADIWMMNQIWFNVFLAWIVKINVLKYWGVRGYRTVMPFFLGLVLGQICGAGIWMLVDAIAGTTGNFIPVGLG